MRKKFDLKPRQRDSFMIKKFTCENFKNISCSDLEFERINILIGANNAGKSNFIRALSFAANMVSNTKTETTGFLSEIKRNGWNRILNKHNDSESFFQCRWSFSLNEKNSLSYELESYVGEQREDNYIQKEALNSEEKVDGKERPYNLFECNGHEKSGVGFFSSAGFEHKQSRRLQAKLNAQETVLLQMNDLFFENKEMFNYKFVRDDVRKVLEEMCSYFQSFYSYSCATFEIATIRQPQDVQVEGDYLKKDGSNFVNIYATLEKINEEFKHKYLCMLQKFMPECEDVKVVFGGGKIWMEVKMQGCYYSLNELSDGTIHLLLMLLLLSLSEPNGVSMLALDEPEMNLHPAWQKIMATEILCCKNFKQCFISTHSADFLDEFTEGFLAGDVGIFVFDQSNHAKPIRKLSVNDLRADLVEWTLGDLYRIGDPMIGGWPQ